MGYIKKTDEGCTIDIYVQPNASRSEIVGEFDGRLKVKIQSPPVEGAANTECVKFFSKLLGVSKSKVKLISGEKSRSKVILVIGKNPEEVKTSLRV